MKMMSKFIKSTKEPAKKILSLLLVIFLSYSFISLLVFDQSVFSLWALRQINYLINLYLSVLCHIIVLPSADATTLMKFLFEIVILSAILALIIYWVDLNKLSQLLPRKKNDQPSKYPLKK